MIQSSKPFVFPVSGILDDTSPIVAVEGERSVVRITPYRALHVNLRNNSGAELTTFPISGSVNQGTAAANSGKWPMKIINSDDTDNSLSTGGQIGQKVMVVGDNDKYIRGSVAEAASLASIEPVFIGVKDSSNNSRGLTGKVVDSRAGADIQHSSIAAKNIIDFYSSDAAQRLLAGQTKIFSPGGTRATYYDLDAYLGFYFSFTDNSPGASGGTLYMRWSRDGTNTAYNDPGDGTGFTNYDTIDTSLLVGAKFVPKKTRYVNFVFIQGASDQGNTYPQIAQMDLTLYPMFYTNAMVLEGNTSRVQGPEDATTVFTKSPFVIAGVDGSSFIQAYSAQVFGSLIGMTVGGASSAVNSGTYLLTANRGNSSATLTNTAVATSSTQIVASATARRGVVLYNDSPYPAYVKYGTAASTTSFTFLVEPFGTWTMPDPIYTGAIHAIATVASGTWRTTNW